MHEFVLQAANYTYLQTRYIAMSTATVIPYNLRMLLPETLWLEPEYYAWAQQESDRTTNEYSQWQAYIQALAQFSFQAWLQEKLPAFRISLSKTAQAPVRYLRANDCKLYLLATEHVLNEQVTIPKQIVDSQANCAHYYVFLEVLEAAQEAIVRGFLRHDELTAKLSQLPIVQTLSTPADYMLPLAHLDSEPHHLVSYIQQLSLCATANTFQENIAPPSVTTHATGLVTRLSHWLEGALSDGWQTIESLVSPDMPYIWATRSSVSENKAGKLINLGVQLDECAVVLLIAVVPKEDEKLGIHIQVLPTGDMRVLPPQLRVSLFSNKGKVLQEVTAREQDNFIQLKPLKGKAGIRFSVALKLKDFGVKEDFEI